MGHYAGALETWVRLQDEHECFFLLADYQVSDYADDIERVRASVREVALDWLAVGLDAEKSHFVVESLVPAHAELKGAVGDVEVKRPLVTVLDHLLAPIRDRRRDFQARPRVVAEALRKGSEVERAVAATTMDAVRGALRPGYREPSRT